MNEQVATLTGDPGETLAEFDDPPVDPVALLSEWLSFAVGYGVREPAAASLATCDQEGRPSSRTILVKSVDHHGIQFGSHRDSRKGRDIAANPWAALTFYWREVLRQINVAGRVHPSSRDESDQLFHARATAAQAAAAVSHQSQPLQDEAELRTKVASVDGEHVPRPEDWVAYRLVPESIEFWHGSPDRLHRRLRYDRTPAGWSAVRLQP